MQKRIFFTFACLIVGCAAISTFAQTSLKGNWEWRSPMDKDKRQTIFGINIIPKGGKVSGTYFFNELQDGETESDGAVAGFIGTVVGNTMKIEFDPEAGEPGYTENVRYKKPKGRLPSNATLTLKNGKIQWLQTRGRLAEDMPKTFTLTRSK
jgi:hypothetical protein